MALSISLSFKMLTKNEAQVCAVLRYWNVGVVIGLRGRRIA